MPRYKSCSGVLIQKSLRLTEVYYGASVPASATCTPADHRGMVVTDDKGREQRFEQPGLNVWRSSFDYWLALRAAASGAEICDATAVMACEPTPEGVRVTLKGKRSHTVTAEYVIDCEGVAGVIKRKLIPHTPSYIATFQTFNEGKVLLDPHYFYAYLQHGLSGYDAWFNVKDGALVLGVSGTDRSSLRVYYNRFLAYMQEKHGLHISKQLKEDIWLMPHIQPGCPVTLGVGHVFFAGEAAGFLNPMGEGISAGLESGHAVAVAMGGCFGDTNGIYRAYGEATQALRDYMRRQWRLVAHMSDAFAHMR